MSKIVVVGANHAGTACINTMLDNYGAENEVVIFDQNSNISFLACGMALWIGQQISKPDGLFYADKETFEAKGAKVYMNSPVESIDYDAKKVTAIVDGKEHVESYDKLILATGSQPILPPIKPRRTEEEIEKECPWASMGRKGGRTPNIITSLELKSEVMEKRNLHLQEKYKKIKETETRFETSQCEDADYLIVSFGSASRIGEKAVELAREQGLKVGLFRPITLWPFPSKELVEISKGKKGILVSEINAGQMVQDVKLAIDGTLPVEHFGRLGGIVPEPEEIVKALKDKLVK